MPKKDNKNPFIDMFQDFGKSMQIPGPDVNQMMDYHRRNFQALQSAAQKSTSSAQTAALKQREALEQTLADISQTYKNSAKDADPSAMMSTQMDLAKRTFDATVTTTTEMADIMRQGNEEAMDLLKERVMQSVEELSSTQKK
ncbi:phasin family protein [Neptunicoccus cionae]|uniref:Phasin domain-containing protein n=1 Tax=Neptunicoccus cionae TaxID=2035344 RepID=A0A916QZ11_9RHOB|nr:TIGR01841 family phasin [Amylibacter cionae]GGA19028.1 hypothetical protein GCM10011498_19770 [Amylibacter cionae]